MRIAIDSTPLLFRSAGVKNYLYHWIASLRRAGGGHTVSCFPFFGPVSELDHERSQTGLLRTVAGLGLLHSANVAPFRLLDLLGRRWDVFHACPQLRKPPRNTAVTATIYDMTCWLMPELHTAPNVRAVKTFADCVMRQADGLIAISEWTRQDALRILGLRPERVRTIYPGVPAAFFQVAPDEVQRIREKHGLARPYALFVGTVEPRKNIAGLLEAWEGLRASMRGRFELVVAGPAGWAEASLVARLRSGANGVRYLGYLPEVDLPAVTAGAEVLVYPSLYEGFGFPVAQAMAAGVPVITSDNSSLPEVAGDGALLVDARSTSDLRGALDRSLSSPDLRRDLGARGRLKAQRYRWEVCASQSLEFFRSVAGE